MSVLTCHFIRYSCCICSDNIPDLYNTWHSLQKYITIFIQDNQVVLLLSERSCSDSPGRSWMVMLQTEKFSFIPLSGTFPANIYILQKLVVIALLNVSSMFDLLVYTSVQKQFHMQSLAMPLNWCIDNNLILCYFTRKSLCDLTLPFLLNGTDIFFLATTLVGTGSAIGHGLWESS